MSEQAWRLLIDEPQDGAWNMAVDDALLDGVSSGRSPITLRFFRWQPACLSLGYFQPFSVVDVNACRAAGVTVVRRPTGGRAILHDRELTYSITLPLSLLGGDQGVLPSYHRLSAGLLEGLRAVGAPVMLAPAASSHADDHGPACFDRPSAHELLLHGRKVVGSAQLRRGRALLQHGSILFQPQVEAHLQCLRLEPGAARRMRQTMEAGVGGLDGYCPCEPAALAEAIAAAFGRVFRVTLEPGRLSADERHAAVQLAATRYRAPAWTTRH